LAPTCGRSDPAKTSNEGVGVGMGVLVVFPPHLDVGFFDALGGDSNKKNIHIGSKCEGWFVLCPPTLASSFPIGPGLAINTKCIVPRISRRNHFVPTRKSAATRTRGGLARVRVEFSSAM